MPRQRTIQYLCLFAVLLFFAHFYFSSSPSSREHPQWATFEKEDGDWDMDVDLTPEILRTHDDTGAGKVHAPGLRADPIKRAAVVSAFQYAWSAYVRDAMGWDEYHPISHRGQNLSSSGGVGYTIVDALDTMLLMGLTHEYSQASDWVRTHLSFDRDGRSRCFNTFETTIRILGGLLSAYHLTADRMYIAHATDLADRIVPVFDTPTGLPDTSVDLRTRTGIPDHGISTAEATTLQLEFRYLAQLTGNATYWYKVEKVMQVVDKARLPSNLAPISMSSDDGTYQFSDIRLGSRGDSYYEYLLKQYLQTGKTEPVYLKMYEDAMTGIHDNLLKKTPKRGVTFTAELIPRGGSNWKTSFHVDNKQDHLVCFLAGSLMLGATTTGARNPSVPVSVPPLMSELTSVGKRDWEDGVALLEGCMETHKTATGLSPEIAMFDADPDQPTRDWHIKGSKPGGPATYDARYMLRPETTESLFLAWRLTGDERYRDYAWGIFQAIETHAKLPGGGYATIVDVDTVPVRHEDKQETFYLSETLKYLFLTFADEEVLSLRDNVFNTEAHPLPVFKPSIKPLFHL